MSGSFVRFAIEVERAVAVVQLEWESMTEFRPSHAKHRSWAESYAKQPLALPNAMFTQGMDVALTRAQAWYTFMSEQQADPDYLSVLHPDNLYFHVHRVCTMLSNASAFREVMFHQLVAYTNAAVGRVTARSLAIGIRTWHKRDPTVHPLVQLYSQGIWEAIDYYDRFSALYRQVFDTVVQSLYDVNAADANIAGLVTRVSMDAYSGDDLDQFIVGELTAAAQHRTTLVSTIMSKPRENRLQILERLMGPQFSPFAVPPQLVAPPAAVGPSVTPAASATPAVSSAAESTGPPAAVTPVEPVAVKPTTESTKATVPGPPKSTEPVVIPVPLIEQPVPQIAMAAGDRKRKTGDDQANEPLPVPYTDSSLTGRSAVEQNKRFKTDVVMQENKIAEDVEEDVLEVQRKRKKATRPTGGKRQKTKRVVKKAIEQEVGGQEGAAVKTEEGTEVKREDTTAAGTDVKRDTTIPDVQKDVTIASNELDMDEKYNNEEDETPGNAGDQGERVDDPAALITNALTKFARSLLRESVVSLDPWPDEKAVPRNNRPRAAHLLWKKPRPGAPVTASIEYGGYRVSDQCSHIRNHVAAHNDPELRFIALVNARKTWAEAWGVRPRYHICNVQGIHRFVRQWNVENPNDTIGKDNWKEYGDQIIGPLLGKKGDEPDDDPIYPSAEEPVEQAEQGPEPLVNPLAPPVVEPPPINPSAPSVVEPVNPAAPSESVMRTALKWTMAGALVATGVGVGIVLYQSHQNTKRIESIRADTGLGRSNYRKPAPVVSDTTEIKFTDFPKPTPSVADLLAEPAGCTTGPAGCTPPSTQSTASQSTPSVRPASSDKPVLSQPSADRPIPSQRTRSANPEVPQIAQRAPPAIPVETWTGKRKVDLSWAPNREVFRAAAVRHFNSRMEAYPPTVNNAAVRRHIWEEMVSFQKYVDQGGVVEVDDDFVIPAGLPVIASSARPVQRVPVPPPVVPAHPITFAASLPPEEWNPGQQPITVQEAVRNLCEMYHPGGPTPSTSRLEQSLGAAPFLSQANITRVQQSVATVVADPSVSGGVIDLSNIDTVIEEGQRAAGETSTRWEISVPNLQRAAVVGNAIKSVVQLMQSPSMTTVGQLARVAATTLGASISRSDEGDYSLPNIQTYIRNQGDRVYNAVQRMRDYDTKLTRTLADTAEWLVDYLRAIPSVRDNIGLAARFVSMTGYFLSVTQGSAIIQSISSYFLSTGAVEALPWWGAVGVLIRILFELKSASIIMRSGSQKARVACGIGYLMNVLGVLAGQNVQVGATVILSVLVIGIQCVRDNAREQREIAEVTTYVNRWRETFAEVKNANPLIVDDEQVLELLETCRRDWNRRVLDPNSTDFADLGRRFTTAAIMETPRYKEAMALSMTNWQWLSRGRPLARRPGGGDIKALTKDYGDKRYPSAIEFDQTSRSDELAHRSLFLTNATTVMQLGLTDRGEDPLSARMDQYIGREDRSDPLYFSRNEWFAWTNLRGTLPSHKDTGTLATQSHQIFVPFLILPVASAAETDWDALSAIVYHDSAALIVDTTAAAVRQKRFVADESAVAPPPRISVDGLSILLLSRFRLSLCQSRPKLLIGTNDMMLSRSTFTNSHLDRVKALFHFAQRCTSITYDPMMRGLRQPPLEINEHGQVTGRCMPSLVIEPLSVRDIERVTRLIPEELAAEIKERQTKDAVTAGQPWVQIHPSSSVPLRIPILTEWSHLFHTTFLPTSYPDEVGDRLLLSSSPSLWAPTDEMYDTNRLLCHYVCDRMGKDHPDIRSHVKPEYKTRPDIGTYCRSEFLLLPTAVPRGRVGNQCSDFRPLTLRSQVPVDPVKARINSIVGGLTFTDVLRMLRRARFYAYLGYNNTLPVVPGQPPTQPLKSHTPMNNLMECVKEYEEAHAKFMITYRRCGGSIITDANVDERSWHEDDALRTDPELIWAVVDAMRACVRTDGEEWQDVMGIVMSSVASSKDVDKFNTLQDLTDQIVASESKDEALIPPPQDRVLDYLWAQRVVRDTARDFDRLSTTPGYVDWPAYYQAWAQASEGERRNSLRVMLTAYHQARIARSAECAAIQNVCHAWTLVSSEDRGWTNITKSGKADMKLHTFMRLYDNAQEKRSTPIAQSLPVLYVDNAYTTIDLCMYLYETDIGRANRTDLVVDNTVVCCMVVMPELDARRANTFVNNRTRMFGKVSSTEAMRLWCASLEKDLGTEYAAYIINKHKAVPYPKTQKGEVKYWNAFNGPVATDIAFHFLADRGITATAIICQVLVRGYEM